MQLKEAIKKRKSIRGYKKTPVPEDKLLAVLEAARLAPSGGNRQQWKFVGDFLVPVFFYDVYQIVFVAFAHIFPFRRRSVRCLKPPCGTDTPGIRSLIYDKIYNISLFRTLTTCIL